MLSRFHFKYRQNHALYRNEVLLLLNIALSRGAYRVLVGKPEGKRPLGRPRRRWVDIIRVELQEAGYGYMDWIGLA